MKKRVFCLILLVIGILLTGCQDMQFGSKYIDDPEQYGKWESYLKTPSFLPASIDDYQVNSYSYTLHSYMDICYEIFVDITVTEDQFDQLITEAKSHAHDEKAAYYCDGYEEIVFQDTYDVYSGKNGDEKNVGWADIEKIVYNSETLNIVYVCFHANDTGVYKLDEVKYFNRFSIKEDEYVSNLS